MVAFLKLAQELWLLKELGAFKNVVKYGKEDNRAHSLSKEGIENGKGQGKDKATEQSEYSRIRNDQANRNEIDSSKDHRREYRVVRNKSFEFTLFDLKIF